MDLLDVLKLVRRRWPVVLPIVLLTLLIGALMVVTRASAYTTSSAYFLTSDATDGSGPEPLDPDVVAQLAPALYGSGLARAGVAESGFVDTFQVAAVPDSPVIRFTVNAPSAELAVGTVEHLVSVGPALLNRAFGPAGRSVAFATVSPPDIADVTENDDGTYDLTSTVSVSQVATERYNPFQPGTETLDWLDTIAADPALGRQIAAVDPSATFTVEPNIGRLAPILNTTVTASSVELAYEIHELVIGRLEGELDALQTDAGVGSDVRTSLRELLPPSEPVLTPSSVVRALAGVVVLGGGLALGTAVVADAFVMRRRTSAKRTEDSAAPIVAKAAAPQHGARVTVESEESAVGAASAAARSPARRRPRERAAPRRDDGGEAAARRVESNGNVAARPAEEPATQP